MFFNSSLHRRRIALGQVTPYCREYLSACWLPRSNEAYAAMCKGSWKFCKRIVEPVGGQKRQPFDADFLGIRDGWVRQLIVQLLLVFVACRLRMLGLRTGSAVLLFAPSPAKFSTGAAQVFRRFFRTTLDLLGGPVCFPSNLASGGFVVARPLVLAIAGGYSQSKGKE